MRFHGEKKSCGILEKTKLCKTEVPCQGKKGDTIREYKAMHEENFLSSWLREDGKGKTRRDMEVDKEVREDAGKKGRRVRVKGEDESVAQHRWRPLTFSAKGKFRSVIRVVLTLTVSRERGRVPL